MLCLIDENKKDEKNPVDITFFGGRSEEKQPLDLQKNGLKKAYFDHKIGYFYPKICYFDPKNIPILGSEGRKIVGNVFFSFNNHFCTFSDTSKVFIGFIVKKVYF